MLAHGGMIFRLEAEELFLGEGKPSTSEAGVSPLPTPHPFPARLGVAPQDPLQRGTLLTEFSPKTRSLYSRRFYLYKRIFVACLARFRVSKAFSLLSRRVFRVQKYFCALPDAVSRFKSTFAACPARFRASKALSWLPRRVFSVQKYFRCLPNAFSVFKSTFVAFPTRFRASKALSWLPRRSFGLQKHFRCFPCAISAFKSDFFLPAPRGFQFGSDKKSSYSEEFLWQRL